MTEARSRAAAGVGLRLDLRRVDLVPVPEAGAPAPGFRFDTDDLKPLLDRTVFELQIEYRR